MAVTCCILLLINAKANSHVPICWLVLNLRLCDNAANQYSGQVQRVYSYLCVCVCVCVCSHLRSALACLRLHNNLTKLAQIEQAAPNTHLIAGACEKKKPTRNNANWIKYL